MIIKINKYTIWFMFKLDSFLILSFIDFLTTISLGFDEFLEFVSFITAYPFGNLFVNFEDTCFTVLL